MTSRCLECRAFAPPGRSRCQPHELAARRRRGNIPPATRQAVLALALYRCERCYIALTTAPGPRQAHIDHRTPVALGGSNAPENLQALCRTCNLTNGARSDLPEIERVLG